MIQSKGIEAGVIKMNDKNCAIPNAPGNTDWERFQAWLAEDESNEPIPFDQEALSNYEE